MKKVLRNLCVAGTIFLSGAIVGNYYSKSTDKFYHPRNKNHISMEKMDAQLEDYGPNTRQYYLNLSESYPEMSELEKFGFIAMSIDSSFAPPTIPAEHIHMSKYFNEAVSEFKKIQEDKSRGELCNYEGDELYRDWGISIELLRDVALGKYFNKE